MSDKLLYSVDAAAEALDISRGQAYKLMKFGFMKFVMLSGDRRIPVEELQRIKKEGCPKVPQPPKKSSKPSLV